MTEQASLPEINHLISAIADETEAAAPAEWDRLVVRANFDIEDVHGVGGEAHFGDVVTSLDISFDALELFEEIHKAFADAGQPLWKAATVTVSSEGDIDIDFSYESSELIS
jgi:hypothetical protein